MRKITMLKLSNWISTPIIVDLIAEDLKAREIPVTLENCKALWLAALESLPSMIGSVPDGRILKKATVSG